MASKRTSRGKQKREMKKIERESDLLVAFSKRKSGIYNKASELSTLCGTLVDILMISPTGKPYCYGDPSSQSIAKTILKNENPSVEEELKQLNINEVNTKNDELLDEKHVAEAQQESLKDLESYGYWSINEEDVDNFDYDQLKKLDTSLVDIANKLISSVLCNGGEINPHAFSCIDELNGVQTNSPYVFGANNNGYEIGATHRSHIYDPKGKGKDVIASLEGTNKTQGPNLYRASGSGNGSDVDHSPKDV